MPTSAIKVSDTEIEVTVQPATPAATVQKYDVNFLESQRVRILADAKSYATARQAEVDEIDDLLTQAAAVGVVPFKKGN